MNIDKEAATEALRVISRMRDSISDYAKAAGLPCVISIFDSLGEPRVRITCGVPIFKNSSGHRRLTDTLCVIDSDALRAVIDDTAAAWKKKHGTPSR